MAGPPGHPRPGSARPWCTSPTPIPSSPLPRHAKETHRLPPRTRDRRLPAHDRGRPQHPRDVDGGACRCCPGTSRPACLGFIKFGDREWTPEELNALKAIASLFAQLQARIVAEDQLRFLAEHDDLTGLNNRRALLAHLDRRLAAGQPGPVSALFLDLDRLKAINDYLGHTAGDWFIRVFAERLREGAEGPNLIARLGGDEFVVVPVAPMTADEAEALASRLQAMLRERVAIDGEMLTRTVSIGVALGVPGRDTTSDLLRRADQAVLAAKSSRRQQDRGVLRRHVAEGRVPQRHRAASAERDRQRRAGPALPARGRHAHRRDPRHRSAGALAAPHARACSRRTRSSASPSPSTWQANWAAG